MRNSMDLDMNNVGERLSFMQLFKEDNFHIEVPIIQRDYAQGRASAKEVRDLFLTALYTYLCEEKSNRDLDFVYGSIKTIGNKKCFIPLDGQQRLTTLFLLHWYLATISGNIISFREKLLFDEKSKFTYETRASSREFCSALIKWNCNINNLLESENGIENSLSKTLQDCGWFFRSWKLDPTIQSMLTMLDAIHQIFSTSPHFYDRLVDENNPVITFLFLNLKHFKLTEDLYIKMNARGKPLTAFENFKAKLEQYIGTLRWDENDKNVLLSNDEYSLGSVKEYFCRQIDTNWADLFWHYRNQKSNDENFDDEVMNFFRFVIANEYVFKQELEPMTFEILLGTEIAKKNNPTEDYEKLTFNFYKSKETLSKEVIESLIKILDCLSNGSEKIKCHLPNAIWFDEEAGFKSILAHNKLLYPARVMLFAYLEFLVHNQTDRKGIEQWMRVIRNLVETTAIDSAGQVINALKSIKNLTPHSNEILEFLRADNNTISFFDGRAVQEERIKACLMSDWGWQRAIMDIDKNAYFTGQIGFIFEFSGVLECFNEKGFPIDGATPDLLRFIEYSKKIECVSDLLKEAGADFLWERAVLTKGDYLITASASRKNFLSTKSNLRDYSWKRLLKLPALNSNIDSSEVLKKRRLFVKEVLDDPFFNGNELSDSLSIICNNVPTDWREHFVQNHRLIGYCKQGFICHEKNPPMIYLFNASQRNHLHVSVESYLFFINHIEGGNFSPFTQAALYSYSGEKLNARSVLKWHKDGYIFEIHIFLLGTNNYKIALLERNQMKIPSQITAVLTQHNAKEEDGFQYSITCDSETSTLEFLEKICNEFNVIVF